MKISKKDLLKFASHKMSIAYNFSVQYFTYKIPKNAVHGRLAKDCWFYCTDFQQFTKPERRYYEIFILTDTKAGFRPALINKKSFVALLISLFIADNAWYNQKCVVKPESVSVYDPRLGHKRVIDGVIRKHNKTVPMNRNDSWKNLGEMPLNIGEYMAAAMYKYKSGGKSSRN